MEQTMTQQHTPGPWVLCREEDASLADPICIHALGRYGIAEVWQALKPNSDHAEEEANARLIAVAPDLLAALEAFVATEIDTNGECHYCGRKASSHSSGCNVMAAQAAIRKATGDA